MTDDNVRRNVALELQASREALEAARRIAEIGEHKSAVNRLYYSAYHAALAVCLAEGLEPKTHRGLVHLLKLHFVKRGTLPEWVESELSKLQTERDLADYEPTYQVDASAYAALSAGAQRLVAELENLLEARSLAP